MPSASYRLEFIINFCGVYISIIQSFLESSNYHQSLSQLSPKAQGLRCNLLTSVAPPPVRRVRKLGTSTVTYPTLGVSKCPWARHLTPNCSWRASWYLAIANRRWCVNVCVNGWMWGINCTALWIKALYKCSLFIYLTLPEVSSSLFGYFRVWRSFQQGFFHHSFAEHSCFVLICIIIISLILCRS